MYLSKTEREEIMVAYGYEDSTEINHYEVGPDTLGMMTRNSTLLFEYTD